MILSQNFFNKKSSLYCLMFISLTYFIIYLIYLNKQDNVNILNNNNYKIKQRIERDNNQFTQGLFFYNNTYLVESSGLYKKSDIHFININNVKLLQQSVKLQNNYFGEGCDLINNFIYQLTWRERIIYKRNKETLQEVQRINLNDQIKEGWGISHQINELNDINIYISDGSNKIYVHDQYFNLIEILDIYYKNGTKTNRLNELEYANGYLYANIYLTSFIVAINIQNGEVVKQYDFNELTELINMRYDLCLNGIAYHSKNNSFWITGKMWPYFWEVELY